MRGCKFEGKQWFGMLGTPGCSSGRVLCIKNRSVPFIHELVSPGEALQTKSMADQALPAGKHVRICVHESLKALHGSLKALLARRQGTAAIGAADQALPVITSQRICVHGFLIQPRKLLCPPQPLWRWQPLQHHLSLSFGTYFTLLEQSTNEISIATALEGWCSCQRCGTQAYGLLSQPMRTDCTRPILADAVLPYHSFFAPPLFPEHACTTDSIPLPLPYQVQHGCTSKTP
eukprot:1161349-Pelagomonas_calceolata.AAC.4